MTQRQASRRLSDDQYAILGSCATALKAGYSVDDLCFFVDSVGENRWIRETVEALVGRGEVSEVSRDRYLATKDVEDLGHLDFTLPSPGDPLKSRAGVLWEAVHRGLREMAKEAGLPKPKPSHLHLLPPATP